MRRLELSRVLALLAFVPLAANAQPWLTQEGDQWVRTFHAEAPAKPRLRIQAHGPVKVDGGVAPKIEYTVKISVRARSRERARQLLERMVPRAVPMGDQFTIVTPSNAASDVVVRAPKLRYANILSSEGSLEVNGVDGDVVAETGADEVKVDRIGGNCSLTTGGGDITVGTVEGFVHGYTGAGGIRARQVKGEVVLRTNGGDITAVSVGAGANVQTGGGTIQLGFVNGPVTASNGGGRITIDVAAGVVVTHNMAGPVRVGEALGIRCDSANGGIVLGKISGPIHVSTEMGNITANLAGSRLADSYLATANGDITVVIPSNLGVTVNAENHMADTKNRILSDFREIQPRLKGMRLIAAGSVNGGGPLLQIAASSGTITLKRQ